jgi:transcriptional regulator NrdR family protein
MRCPSCGYSNTSVRDSRPTSQGLIVHRRRDCNNCGHRFSTYEISKDAYESMLRLEGYADEIIAASAPLQNALRKVKQAYTISSKGH